MWSCPICFGFALVITLPTKEWMAWWHYRYIERAEGPWRMRIHGPVIVQCTDCVIPVNHWVPNFQYATTLVLGHFGPWLLWPWDRYAHPVCIATLVHWKPKLANIEFRMPHSEWYLFNAIRDTNHNANPTNPNRNSKGNPNPTNLYTRCCCGHPKLNVCPKVLFHTKSITNTQ